MYESDFFYTPLEKFYSTSPNTPKITFFGYSVLVLRGKPRDPSSIDWRDPKVVFLESMFLLNKVHESDIFYTPSKSFTVSPPHKQTMLFSDIQ